MRAGSAPAQHPLAALLRLILLCALCFGAAFSNAEQRFNGTPSVALAALPPEARQTLVLIEQGGPYPFAKDGSIFGNYERRLPPQARGYYREFTVPTPRARNRGAQRLITGRIGEIYYTDDHYRSFQRVRTRE